MVSSSTQGNGKEWPFPWQEVVGNRNGLRAWVEYVGTRCTVELCSSLPHGIQRHVIDGFARLARHLDKTHADAARSFLQQAFGAGLPRAAQEAMVLGTYRHLFTMVVREARFHRRVPPESLLSHFRVEMCADVRRVLDNRTGALLVSGHVGDWEALLALLPRLGFAPLYVVTRPLRNRPLSRIIQRARESRGVRLLHKRGAVRAITHVMSAGGYVGMLIDQRAVKKTVLAPFFGRPVRCERTIPVLSRRLGVPIVMGVCYATEQPYQYEARFPKVFWPGELAGVPHEEVITRIHQELESMILAHPEQYLWLHDRYRNAPPPGLCSQSSAVPLAGNISS